MKFFQGYYPNIIHARFPPLPRTLSRSPPPGLMTCSEIEGSAPLPSPACPS